MIGIGYDELLKRLESPRRYHVVYWDTKKLYSKDSTFRSVTAAYNFIQSKKIIGMELIIIDSETNKIVMEKRKWQK